MWENWIFRNSHSYDHYLYHSVCSLMTKHDQRILTHLLRGSTTVSSGGSTQTPGACSGTVYTIQSGDTCNSVASAQGINTVDLLAVNNIASCSTFPTSGSLCIPALSKCKTYTVQSGDTCASVADANGLTWTQVVTWNPEVGTQCTFMSTYVGYQICISTPGGAWVNPSPVTTTSSTTTYVTLNLRPLKSQGFF